MKALCRTIYIAVIYLLGLCGAVAQAQGIVSQETMQQIASRWGVVEPDGHVETAFLSILVSSAPPATADVVCTLTTGNCTGTGGGSSLFTAATCNGSADDGLSFRSFVAWATGTWQASHTGLIELDIPNGAACIVSAATAVNCPQAMLDSCLFVGLKKLLVMGYGASITATGGLNLSFGGEALRHDNGVSVHCALISSVSAGATQVTALTPTDAGLLTVDNYGVVLGFDMQGLWFADFGYPPNPGFFDYVKITTTNTSTGNIGIDRVLTADYKSTWPKIGADPGPATICPLPASWDAEFDFRGLTITQGGGDGGTKAEGRKVTWRDVTFTGGNGPYATQNGEMNFVNVTCTSCLNESDKMVELQTFTGGSFFYLKWQSSSIKETRVNGTAVANTIEGSTRKFVGNNISVARIAIGSYGFGATDSFSCTTCTIGSSLFDASGLLENGNAKGIDNVYTMSGGVIAIPNAVSVTNMVDNGSGLVRLTVACAVTGCVTPTAGFITNQWITVGGATAPGCCGGIFGDPGTAFKATVINGTTIDLQGSTFSGSYSGSGRITAGANTSPGRFSLPGANLFFSGAKFNAVPFYITDVTQDGVNIYIHTNLAGGFPSIDLTGNVLSMRIHPAPHYTCTTCGTFSDNAIASAPAAPIWSAARYSCDGSYSYPFGAGTICAWPQLWGKAVSVSAAVNPAYTGVTNPVQFNVFKDFVTIKPSDFSNYTMQFQLKVNTAGTRTLTCSGGSCSVGGVQTGDTWANPPEQIWMTGFPNAPAYYEQNISGQSPAVWPLITVTITTDQGLHPRRLSANDNRSVTRRRRRRAS